ncbi:hypothetical protein [Sphingomonas sp. S6]|uniref:hypothetical protein n=1 Tax=Sphingomonas sp. S6 TaxID=3368600 RepID=UPI0028E58859|nr:hypothetical protein [uncultured Sphingomonas sp.]
MILNSIVPIFSSPPLNPDALIEVMGFTRAAALTVIAASVAFTLKIAWDAFKFWENRERWKHAEAQKQAAEEKLNKEAESAVRRGLAELERHHWENQLVIRTMMKRIDDDQRMPLEYQVDRLSIMPLPRFLLDDQIARLSDDKAVYLTKLQRMIPNFEREYQQAAKLLREGKLVTFRSFLKTLDIKAAVGMRVAGTTHQSMFGSDLGLHPDRSPAGSTKPLDFYEDEPDEA